MINQIYHSGYVADHDKLKRCIIIAKKESWLKDINPESIKASLNAGVIYPALKCELRIIYRAKIISDIRTFQSDYGTGYAIDLEYNGMNHSLVIPISFRFQLAVEMERYGLNPETDFNKLIGKWITFKKSIGSTKEFKNAELYSVQLEM